MNLPQMAGTRILMEGGRHIQIGPICKLEKNSSGAKETTVGYYVRYIKEEPEEKDHDNLVEALLDVAKRVSKGTTYTCITGKRGPTTKIRNEEQ